MSIFHQEIIHHLGLTLLHFIWQGLLAGLVYGAILLVWRPASASARYHLAVATLATLAALPALTLWWLVGRAETVVAGPVGAAESLASAAFNSLAPGLAHDPMVWIVVAWLAGVVLLSARLALGWHYILRLRRSADHAATASLAGLVETTRRRLTIGRRVILAASTRVRAPLVIGYLKPLILFPPAMLNRMSLDQIELVLAHEMAHIRRHDHLVNVFQTVVETLLFYHPVVAWVSRQIRIERENACDDLAVEVTGNRLGYVEMLASLERLRQPLPRLALSIQDGQILGRIRRLVEPGQPTRQRGLTLPAVALVTLVASATAVHLVPESTPEESGSTAATSSSAPVQATARSDRQQAEAGETESIDDPLNWDFPEPGPAASAEARPADPDAAVQPTAPRSSAARQEPATSPRETAPAQATATAPEAESRQPDPLVDAAAPTEPVPATAQTTPEPALETAVETEQARPLQLAALPASPRPRAEPATVVEIEPPQITGGELIHRVDPRFPARARLRQTSGLVELEFVVSSNGRTTDIKVIEETPGQFGFGHAARTAVAQWRFEPFRQGENSLDRRVRMEIEFNPEDGCLETLGSRIPRC